MRAAVVGPDGNPLPGYALTYGAGHAVLGVHVTTQPNPTNGMAEPVLIITIDPTAPATSLQWIPTEAFV